jgi:hypothetical protein
MIYCHDRITTRRQRIAANAMPDVEQSLVTYLDLACVSRRRRRLSESDKLLVLAAVAATQLGWPVMADECRQHVLAHNPWHMLRRWPSVATAMTSDRFAAYLKHIERQYPPEKAEYMLACLGQRPVFTGSSAREMAESMLERLARLPAVVQRSRGDEHSQAHSDGHSARKPGSKGRKRQIRLPGRGVAKRLRGKKRNQEFLWWPYCVGLAGLAVVAIVCFSRLRG